jgi:hypothetical protein
VRRARAVAAGALAAAALGAGPSRAQSPAVPPVPTVLGLTLESCPQIDEARLRELFVIELGTVRPSGARDVDVHVACDGARVAVELRDRALGRSWRADVDLAAAPEATRLRLLVLAVTEQWSLERPPAAPPAPPPSAPTPDVPVVVRAPAAASPPAWRLEARAVARRTGAPGLWLGGGGVGLERAFGRRVAVALDVSAEAGEATASVARVRVRELVGSAELLATAAAGRWSFGAGPGFSVGLASLAATPFAADASGGRLDAVWAGPTLAARARLALGRGVSLAADVGAGTTSRGVTGLVDQQATLFELGGPWLALGLGASVSF